MRDQIRTAMRVWTRQKRVLWWVTLTSSPDSPKERLRADFQAWRKRLARQFDLEPADVQYAMVDTREGHGVLHLVLAFPQGIGSWIPYRAVGEWWREIHGARQVKLLPVKKGDGSVRRLSHYLVSQYMVTQGEVLDLLGRLSTSRFSLPLRRWRQQLLHAVTPRVWAYQKANESARAWGAFAAQTERSEGRGEGPLSADAMDRLYRELRSLQFREFRRCWASLLDRGWCSTFGSTWVVEGQNVVPL